MTTTPPVIALLLAASTASAAITIDTVFVGNAGNANDTTGYGGVAYDYHIGTYEVTNSQYTAFLNAVAATDTHSLYNSNMGTNAFGGISQSGTTGSFTYSTKADMANKPVNYVSFWDAARFANWLTNGQGSGDTETGVYELTSAGISNNSITRNNTAFNNGGVAVASENEWYKAAYYDGNGSYYDYPTQSDTEPQAEDPPGGINSANFSNAVDGGSVTQVGAYTNSISHYGTFDQGGNQNEWTDQIFESDPSKRALRGGSFNGDGDFLRSLTQGKAEPTIQVGHVGFRVTSLAPIPEPSSYGAIFGIVGLATAIFFRRKRRRG